MNLFLTKQKMPTLRSVSACSVTAVDKSASLWQKGKTNANEIYILLVNYQRDNLCFSGRRYLKINHKYFLAILAFHVIMEA